ncbi:MAG: hypothetical protein IJA10_04590 [Lachnospiraceae bacterium]|nr:hypothetical protein [Lachnospiraceae bacterium]
MKQKCAIVRDLYILYEEDSIAEESKSYVREHLTECKNCREYYEKMQDSFEFPEDEEEIVKEKEFNQKEEKRIKKSFRKIRQRWIASLVLIAILVPVTGMGTRLTINQMDGYGLKFTNIDDVRLCKKWFQSLQDGEYHEATKMLINHLEDYYEWKKLLDEWGSKYDGEKFLLNGEEWYMLDDTDAKIEDEEEYWNNAIGSYQSGVLIPEDIWKKYVPNQGIMIWNESGVEKQYYYPNQKEAEAAKAERFENGDTDKGFVRMDTEWGVYYINCWATGRNNENGNGIMYRFDKGEKSSVALCASCTYVPAQIVEDANGRFEEFYEEQKAWFEETYQELATLEEEQIEEYFKNRTAGKLESFFSNGCTIEKIIYSDAEQFPVIAEEGYDSMERISIVIKNPEGKLEEGCFTMGTKDGKIRLLHVDTNSEQLQNLFEIMVYFE